MTQPVEWKISNKLIDYDFAISLMEKRVLNIKRNSNKELVWLLEHESIYTAGTSAKDNDLINNKVEIRHTGRGGQWTWHGPGQRVVYLMLNLKNRLPDIKAYVHALEELIILSLSDFNIYGVRIKNQPGVWVNTNNRLDKVAAFLFLSFRISRFNSLTLFCASFGFPGGAGMTYLFFIFFTGDVGGKFDVVDDDEGSIFSSLSCFSSSS